MSTPGRPPFIIATAQVEEEPSQYPKSDEVVGFYREIGKVAGLLRHGLHVCRLPPGHRTSYPHAERDEEEFVYVLEGEVDGWIDGTLYRMERGDLAAFPCGTGISHTFLNNGAHEALLLVCGEKSRDSNKIYYPLNPERRADMTENTWWDDAPQKLLGPHNGKPRTGQE